MDGRCFEAFLEHLGEAYCDHHLVLVVDNAPSHLSKEITHPENVSLLNLPAYSPELKPVGRWFLEFRGALSNRARSIESVEMLQEVLTEALAPYTGKTPLSCDGSPVTRGGWRPSTHWDINELDRYNTHNERGEAREPGHRREAERSHFDVPFR